MMDASIPTTERAASEYERLLVVYIAAAEDSAFELWGRPLNPEERAEILALWPDEYAAIMHPSEVRSA